MIYIATSKNKKTHKKWVLWKEGFRFSVIPIKKCTRKLHFPVVAAYFGESKRSLESRSNELISHPGKTSVYMCNFSKVAGH